MKKSPFTLLKEAIENELFDISLQLQYVDIATGVTISNPYFLGYIEALKRMLARAEAIYNRRERA